MSCTPQRAATWLIECRADIKAYNGFAIWLTSEPDASVRLGWRKLPSDNPFLEEYRLGSPINVFGHATSNIAFTATGPMAVLDDISPEALANSLGLTVAVENAGKFMAEKTKVENNQVKSSSEDSSAPAASGYGNGYGQSTAYQTQYRSGFQRGYQDGYGRSH
jgi:hypothetical protein